MNEFTNEVKVNQATALVMRSDGFWADQTFLGEMIPAATAVRTNCQAIDTCVVFSTLVELATEVSTPRLS